MSNSVDDIVVVHFLNFNPKNLNIITISFDCEWVFRMGHITSQVESCMHDGILWVYIIALCNTISRTPKILLLFVFIESFVCYLLTNYLFHKKYEKGNKKKDEEEAKLLYWNTILYSSTKSELTSILRLATNSLSIRTHL